MTGDAADKALLWLAELALKEQARHEMERARPHKPKEIVADETTNAGIHTPNA